MRNFFLQSYWFEYDHRVNEGVPGMLFELKVTGLGRTIGKGLSKEHGQCGAPIRDKPEAEGQLA